VKLFLCLINYALWRKDKLRSAGITPPVLTSAASQPGRFALEENPRYPLERKPVWRRCGRCGKEKNIFACKDSNPGQPGHSPYLKRQKENDNRITIISDNEHEQEIYRQTWLIATSWERSLVQISQDPNYRSTIDNTFKGSYKMCLFKQCNFILKLNCVS
jgi:hypothetical protein